MQWLISKGTCARAPAHCYELEDRVSTCTRSVASCPYPQSHLRSSSLEPGFSRTRMPPPYGRHARNATSACSAPQCTEHAAGALPAASQFAGRPTPDKLCGIAASTFVRTHCPRDADLALAIRTCKLLLVKPCQTLTGPCQLSNFDIDTIDKV